ncbi:MAG TPA: DUF4111 domain-containing protein [Firmicutes bacterium]|nr:DUF4111 domain-containing protein [Bacillota bacterium]
MNIEINRENLPKQAIQVMAIAEELFKEQLLGIYLYGSAILGGLHPNSDIDLLIMINGEMAADIRKKITKQLLDISGKIGCMDRRPLEVTVINRQDLIPWQFPPKSAYMYGEWLREGMETGKIPQSFYDPDIAILLWQARTYSVPLKGEPAANFIPFIPYSEIPKAIQTSLPGLISGLKGDERNVLLTLSRMWFTLATGEICPKNVAAAWVRPKLPPDLAPLIEMAEKSYLGECTDKWDHLENETDLLVEFMKNNLKNILEKSS